MCESLQNPQQVELLQKVQRLEQMLSLAAATNQRSAVDHGHSRPKATLSHRSTDIHTLGEVRCWKRARTKKRFGMH